MATRSWNRVELIGNLTRDPEMRFTPTGTAVCTFTIATNRTFMSEGERREEADFHRIVAWAKLAELCSQLLKKGNRVFVSGRLQNRSWEGQDGQQRQTTEIVIEDMILLTSAGSYTEKPTDLGEAVDINEFRSAAKAETAEKAPPKKEIKADEAPEAAEAKPKPAKEDKEDIDIDDLPF